MKLLVTGGAGFIGSALVRQALARGHRVINLDALTYSGSLQNGPKLINTPGYVFERADIRDRVALDRIFADHHPDAVIHLAAESHVDRSIHRPDDFMTTNVMGTFHLLEAALIYWRSRGEPSAFRFHHVSTDEVFGSLALDTEDQFDEESGYDPRSPYSASKASADHLVRAWHHTYGLPIVLTNTSNNYGPFQYPEKLIPVLIINALARKDLPIYGNGSNVRDWLYVDDHIEALLLVAEQGDVGRTYVVGSGHGCSNLALAQRICAILDRLSAAPNGRHADRIKFVTDRPGHDARYAINPARIQAELGWQPRITLDEGLERTVRWYLDNEAWWRPLLAPDSAAKRRGAMVPAEQSL